MKSSPVILPVMLTMLLHACSSTSTVINQEGSADAATKTLLAIDPRVSMGKLENGLVYYIRENVRPENRAELRLVVNAGSILENEDQQGLAHFVEHMAFNGTEKFHKQELVDYLESIGMRFGPDLNAYTSFDETVYMLQIPTDTTEIVDTAFDILYEWANKVQFAEEEIDKERGVVGEEWRLGRGASARIRDKQFPILFHNSRYAERLPIGQKAVLDSFPYETLRQFYRDWYRPDLMAVIAVGDFNKTDIEARIKQVFSAIPAHPNARMRQSYNVPDHDQSLFSVETDPEAMRTNISIYYKKDITEAGSEEAYRKSLVQGLAFAMLNSRLDELRQAADAPFIFGYAGEGRFIRTKAMTIINAATQDDEALRGIEAVLTEAKRAREHGFLSTELERQKVEFLRSIERGYSERDKTESRHYAAEYIRNFLQGEPIPGIEFEFELTSRIIPEISVEEVNQVIGDVLSEKNRVVLIQGPESASELLPDETRLLEVFAAVGARQVEPYVDSVSDEPLLGFTPEPGYILSESRIDTVGVTEWTLSNGARVLLKPTDFKNDQIVMSSYSPGGHSLVDDEDHVSALIAASVVSQGGVGSFNEIELEKKLAGKMVSVSPWIAALEEGFTGSASPQDLETFFQLVHLYFTAPRKDQTAYQSYRKRIETLLANKEVDPNVVFQDTITATMSRHHFRSRPWTEAMLQEMDLDRSFSIYRNRFADASDFTFLFVGNIDVATFRPLVETYLASLPALKREESWRDVGITAPTGTIRRTMHRGLEPKSQVRLIITGPFEWTRENRSDYQAMASVLRIKLRETLREDKGGTYGVSVSASSNRYPTGRYRFTISFGCAPERVDELTYAVYQQLDSLKAELVDQKYITKVQETDRRTHETNLQSNRYWMNALEFYHKNDIPLEAILDRDKLTSHITAERIRETAKQYLKSENQALFVLYPQDEENEDTM